MRIPPSAILVAIGTFGADLGFDVSGTASRDLAGEVVTFQSFAIGASGKIIDSAPEVVTFQ